MPGITEIKNILTARASEARAVIRRAPLRWLLVVSGAVLALALLLEGSIAYEFWAMLWRDDMGNLSFADNTMAVLFGAITAMVLGVVLHVVYIQVPPRAKWLFYVALAAMAVIVIMAGPIAVTLGQPGMGGNTIEPTGEKSLFDRTLYWTTLSRSLLFLLAAIVAAFGIGMMHEGLKGLVAIREAKVDSIEHEEALGAITVAEQEAKVLPDRLDQFQDALKRDFAIVYRDAVADDASRVEQYLAGERMEPVNSFNLDDTLRDLVRPENGGSNNFLMKLVDASRPKPINFRALPARASDLPAEARRMLSDHAGWLRASGDINTIMEELK